MIYKIAITNQQKTQTQKSILSKLSCFYSRGGEISIK
jgi:hypothetical protein